MNDNLQSSSNEFQYANRYMERALRRAERAQYRAERRAMRYTGGAWIIGAGLIVFGAIILLQNMGALYLQNWWALFIMIPALGSFATAYGAYRNNGGRLTAMVRGSFMGGLLISAIAVVFLFDLNFSLLLPIILIIGGLGLLFNTALPD
ncbi:MAG TPA: hypothetical protein VMP08_05420 [Anaerolineae bacterium]|nr:hypothetical protein [Anaerolineae bacterium]